MLILENLSYQAAKRSFINSSRKFIKFSINEHIISTKQAAKVKSQTLLEWQQPVSLPLFLNAKYHFQIFQQHSFGYNPEELNQIACGTFTINEDDSYNTWEVVSDRGNKLGFISSKIRRKLRYAPNVSTAMPQSQIMTISSIITHLSFLKQKRGYIVLTLAGKAYKTQITKSKAGQLLFTQQIQIQKTDQIYDAKVQVFSFDAKDEKSQLVATGILKMDHQHLQKKLIVRNEKGETAEVFIDYKITSKELYTSSKELSKIVQRNSLFNRSNIDQTVNHSASRTLNQSRFGNESIVIRSKAHKPSVVNHNNNVFMPSEKRFMDYNDKQNHIVSYLKQKDPFDFKQEHSKNYYKGASIGVGDKLDFTNVFKMNPGVGAYHLPSIWDRY